MLDVGPFPQKIYKDRHAMTSCNYSDLNSYWNELTDIAAGCHTANG